MLPGSPQADSRRTVRLSRVGSGRDDAWPFRLIGFDRSVLIDAPNRHTAVGKATNVGPGASNDAAKPAIDSSGVWLVPASSQARESTPSLLSDPRSADFPKLPVQPLCVGADQLLGSAGRAMRRNGKGRDLPDESQHLAARTVTGKMTFNGLDSSNAGLAELSAELPDVVLVLDYLGRVQWGNHAAERMFGRTLSDSIGFSCLDLVHPEDLELVLRSFASVQRKGDRDAHRGAG